jgi:hypothetical protein
VGADGGVPVTDLVLSSAPIRGATLTLALLVLDPAGDRGEEVELAWAALLGLCGWGARA